MVHSQCGTQITILIHLSYHVDGWEDPKPIDDVKDVAETFLPKQY